MANLFIASSALPVDLLPGGLLADRLDWIQNGKSQTSRGKLENASRCVHHKPSSGEVLLSNDLQVPRDWSEPFCAGLSAWLALDLKCLLILFSLKIWQIKKFFPSSWNNRNRNHSSFSRKRVLCWKKIGYTFKKNEFKINFKLIKLDLINVWGSQGLEERFCYATKIAFFLARSESFNEVHCPETLAEGVRRDFWNGF